MPDVLLINLVNLVLEQTCIYSKKVGRKREQSFPPPPSPHPQAVASWFSITFHL